MTFLILTVLCGWSCGSEPAPTSPSIAVPTGLLVVQASDLNLGYTGSELTVEISNQGQGSLMWTIGAPQWVTVTPTAGTLTPTSSATLRLSVSRQGLPSGSQSAQIQVNSNGGNHTIHLVVDVLELRAQSGLTVNVRDHGAVGDGRSDDTPAFNSALTALASTGGVLYVPEGTYILSPESGTPDRALDLSVSRDITVAGDGVEKSIIKMAPGQYHGDTHLVFLRRSRYIAMVDLTLDGNKSFASFSDEQNHCVEAWSSVEIRFQRVRFQNCRGDGIRLMGAPSAGEPWTEAITIRESDFRDNGRSGIAVQRAVRNLYIVQNTFEGISDQSIDIEPTGSMAPTDVLIEGNVIRHSTATWALGIGGIGGTDVARRLTVRGNQVLQGAVLIYKVDQLVLEDNLIVGDPRHAPLRLTHSVTNAQVIGNEIRGSTGGEDGVVQLVALNDAYPSDVLLSNNTIISPENSSGVFVRDALGRIELVNNEIVGAGSSVGGTKGIHISSIVGLGTTRHTFAVRDNVIRNFSVGIQLSTSGDPFSAVTIDHNVINGDADVISNIIGILFDKTGPYETFATVDGNLFGVGVVQPVLIR